MTSSPPRFIGISVTDEWIWEPDGQEDGMVEYRLTTHAFARANPDRCIWLSATCGACREDARSVVWDECETAAGTFECARDGCGRGPTPYRPIVEADNEH